MNNGTHLYYNRVAAVFNRLCSLDSFLSVLKCMSLCCVSAGSGETASLDSIDSYMKKLHNIVMSSPQEHEHLISLVRDVVNCLDR